MGQKIKSILQIVFFAILGMFIMYLLWQSLGKSYAEECVIQGIPESECSLLDKLIQDFKGANPFWLLVISICFVISHIFRSVRWVILMKPMGYNISQFNSFACTLVGYFANLGAPRIGEFVRAGLISKYEHVPVEKAFATVVIERVIDVIMLILFLVVGLFFHYDQLWGYIQNNINISTNTWLIILGILIGLTITGLYILKKILSLDVSKLPPWMAKVKKMIQGFVEGIFEIRKLPNVSTFVLCSVGIWVMYFFMHYFAFFAYEPVSHLSIIDGILVFDFGSIGIAFPSQGGLGSYHVMIVEALKILGIPPVDGMSFAMITFFTLTIFCTVIVGMICLILLPIVNKGKKIGP